MELDSSLKEGTCDSEGYTVAKGSVPFLGELTIDLFIKPSNLLEVQSSTTNVY